MAFAIPEMETIWTIPAIGGRFRSEDEAYRFLGQLWGRISELLTKSLNGYIKEQEEWIREKYYEEDLRRAKSEWFERLEGNGTKILLDIEWSKTKTDYYAKRLLEIFLHHINYSMFCWSFEKTYTFLIELKEDQDPIDYWLSLATKDTGSTKFFVWSPSTHPESKYADNFHRLLPESLTVDKEWFYD